MIWQGHPLLAGAGSGNLLTLTAPLSFWGGVDPQLGVIVDNHHPQAGLNLTGTVLVMPESRGSSSSSTVLAEMIRTGRAPAAIVLGHPDAVVVLGAVVAAELYDLVVPVLSVPDPVPPLPTTGRAAVSPNGELTVEPW